MARKLAKDLGIDLALVKGTGPHQSICKEDITTYADRSKAEKPKPLEKASKTSAMREAIARSMSHSKREIPHYYLQNQLDMDPALGWLDQLNQDRGASNRVLPAALYIKAIALACAKVPEMNGFWVEGSFHPSQSIHVGMGISLRSGGLVAPAIHHVEQKSIEDIMDDLRDVVARARAGKLRSSEISDATITITSMGDQGVESVYGVIYPPQVAIVGFGRINQRPWALGSLLGVRPVLTTTLSGDHRASDGHRGGIFLNHVEKILSNPSKMEL